MKKSMLVFVLVLLVGLIMPLAGQEKKKAEAGGDHEGKVVQKTYELKHVSPASIHGIISPYILQLGQGQGSSIMVVTLREANTKALEDLLNKLDQPKKSIRFRVFTVIASNQSPDRSADLHPELQAVVGELRQVLGYKNYQLDGVSLMTVSEGARFSEMMLNSKSGNLRLSFSEVNISDDSAQGRVVSTGLTLDNKGNSGNTIIGKDQQVLSQRLISIEKSQLREGGYLVAGVSSLGSGGDALVLVINAEIE